MTVAPVARGRKVTQVLGLAAWIDANSKNFETIAQTRAADAELTNRALDIVRRFIIEKGLILYGGQAIDFALRLKGSKIYPAHQTPDYDCFSPQNVGDAYSLADRLVAAGFPNVSAIPAIHVQTMKVATDFVYIADFSYAPPEVFERLPTVSYAGMRVLHPDYQRTDIHLAFCFPYGNPPREDVFHRYRKDLKRFRLLQEYYPIVPGKTLNAPVVGGRNPSVSMKTGSVTVDPLRIALHGFAALAAMQKAFAELVAAASLLVSRTGRSADAIRRARSLAEKMPTLDIKAEARPGRRAFISASSPDGNVSLATPWPDEVVDLIADRNRGNVVWFAPYMDSRPLMAQVDAGDSVVHVHSTRNRLVAVAAVMIDKVQLLVVSPQYVLLNLLYEAQVAKDQVTRDKYIEYYAGTLSLIEAAGLLFAALYPGPPTEKLYRSLVENSPFGLPMQTIGDKNWDNAYLIRLAQSAERVGTLPPGVQPADFLDLSKIPSRYYPGGKHKVGDHPRFDYASTAFQRGGQQLPALDKGERSPKSPESPRVNPEP